MGEGGSYVLPISRPCPLVLAGRPMPVPRAAAHDWDQPADDASVGIAGACAAPAPADVVPGAQVGGTRRSEREVHPGIRFHRIEGALGVIWPYMIHARRGSHSPGPTVREGWRGAMALEGKLFGLGAHNPCTRQTHVCGLRMEVETSSRKA